MSRAVVAIIGILFVAAVGIYGFQAALADAGEETTVDNETWTPTAGSVTVLDNSNLTGAYYDDEVDVYDENGTVMVEGTDYEWYDGNGTVRTLAGGGLDGDSEATITYGFQQTTSEQRALAGILSRLPLIIGVLAPVLGIVVLLLILKG